MTATNPFGDFGIQPEQGPPLLTPLSFFFTAPLAIIAAGALLLLGDYLLVSRVGQWTLGLTHVGTLGFLAAIMLGAMYQMLPVVAGSPVPLVRLSHLVHATLVAGFCALVWAFLGNRMPVFTIAWICLAVSFTLFLLPVATALARAPKYTATVAGMAVAVTGLAALATLGAVMARTRAGAPAPSNSFSLLDAHMALGGIVWLGGLLTAVSWQVIPMFYLTEEHPRWMRRAVTACVAITGIAVVVLAWLGGSQQAMFASAAPGAIAVWLLHPVASIRLLLARKRRRVDDSIRFWFAGLTCAPLVAAMAVATWRFNDARWPLLLGWTLLWGWAGLIAHGMLTRIVPFLVWFHRYAPRVGHESVPPMRRLFPAGQVRAELAAHLFTLVCGWCAIATRDRWLAQATGLGLCLTGCALLAGLVRVAMHLRTSAAPAQ